MSSLLSISTVFSYIGYIIIAIIVLLLMVLIHELGHYIAGKILKFKINEFSVGFGPKLFQKKKKNGEVFSLRAIPLGGYCAFEGETEEGNESPEAFHKQKPWKRLIVLFSGAFFNFLSAVIFSFILLFSAGYDLVEVKSMTDSSINAKYFQTGDVFVGVENDKIDFVSDDYFGALISENVKEKYPTCEDISTQYNFKYQEDDKTFYLKTEKLMYIIERNNVEHRINGRINVVYNEEGEYQGWSLLSTNKDSNEFEIGTYKYSFGEALMESVPFTCKWAWKVLVIFGQLITGKLAITSLGGPVTTINMIASYTQTSFSSLLILLPVIAVNLAVFNLLPIPALDGCQMLFVLIEWIRKKPLKQETVNLINNIGLLVLLGFVVVVDVMQFVL